MNLLEEIRSKIAVFHGTTHLVGIEAILNHIEIAEKHLTNGRRGEDYLYSDVIYRSNQAFEGALKEAYEVLTGKPAGNLSTHRIEKYFSDESILKERVSNLFTTYRTEWRNESTHNHKLYFSGQEAFLAIVTISAFVSILLDQMVEKISSDKERLALEAIRYSFSSSLVDYPALPLVGQVIELLKGFSREALAETDIKSNKLITETELIGKMLGYFSVADPSMRVSSDVSLTLGSKKMRVDLILEKNDDKILVEVKRQTNEFMRRVREGIEQVYSYLAATGLSKGILFCPPILTPGIIDEKHYTRDVGNKSIEVIAIYPRSSQYPVTQF